MIVAIVSSPNFDKVRLVENYVCDLSTSTSSLSLDHFSGLDWSVGFWIKVPMIAGVEAELLFFQSTLCATPLIFKVITFDSSNYSMCHDPIKCLTFTGSGDLADSNYGYIRKIARNNWHYLTFSIKNMSSYVDIIATADAQADFLVSRTTLFSPSNTRLLIGSDFANGSSVCKLVMHIHRVDLFGAAYSSQYGASFDQAQLFSFPGGGFTVLYRMNQSPSAYNLLNLLNPETKKATIKSERTTKAALQYPIIPLFSNFFIFQKPKFTIYYPGDVVPESPADNSYSFVVNFRHAVTNKCTFSCFAANSCLNVVVSFKPYIRSPKNDSSFASIGAKSDIVLATNKNNLSHISNNTLFLQHSFNFVRTGSGYYQFFPIYFTLSVNVKNNILMTLPQSRMCYAPQSAQFCSVWRNVNSPLMADDLHTTTAEQNDESFLFYLIFNEISFLDTTELVFINTYLITNGNSKNLQVISGNFGLIKRIFNDSYFFVDTTSTVITTDKRNCSMNECIYCELGRCYGCSAEFELIGNDCIACADDYVYDIVSKKCYQRVNSTLDLIALVPVVNSVAQNKIVIMSYVFYIIHYLATMSELDKYTFFLTRSSRQITIHY